MRALKPPPAERRRCQEQTPMSRINPVARDTTNDATRRLFDGIQKRLGMVPNMMRTIGHSSQALEGYLGLSGALSRGLLPAQLQEQIALAVAEANACDYCLSAHSTLGRGTGLSEDQLDASREGRASDPKASAALQFARALVERRGGVTDGELARVRAAGFSDGEIVEIVAHVALNVFTNYFNRTAQTEIDFPKVTARKVA
jgi:uncharacterized peroxidase-related enzyme